MAGLPLPPVVVRSKKSALRHGCTREDIEHAYDLALGWDILDDDADPQKLLFIGPDLAGNFLELVGCELSDGDVLIWHAMPCQPKYLGLLPKAGGEI